VLAREMANGRRMMSGGAGATPEAVALLSERVALETRLRQAITQMDFPRVHDLNDAAVAMVVSDLDGVFVAGTAFSVASNGLMVTNRHILRTKEGKPPRRISVLFANTTEWKEARVLRLSADADLGLMQVDGPTAVPVVAGEPRGARHARRLTGGVDRLSARGGHADGGDGARGPRAHDDDGGHGEQADRRRAADRLVRGQGSVESVFDVHGYVVGVDLAARPSRRGGS
jgi:hypothetical protein